MMVAEAVAMIVIVGVTMRLFVCVCHPLKVYR